MDQDPVTPGTNPPMPKQPPVDAGAGANTNTNIDAGASTTAGPVNAGANVNTANSAASPMPDWVKNNPAVVAGPNGSVVEPATPAKKKRTGLIVLIVALIVLLVGFGAFAAWYFFYYSNPDKVAYDAIDGFLQQKTVVTNGLVTGRGKFDGGEVDITVNLNSRTNGANGESTVNAKINILDENGTSISEHDYEVELGGIVLEDGVIYLRLNKLADTMETLIKDTGSSVEMLEGSTLALYNLFEEVDGEWWRISIPEIIDDVVVDTEAANAAKETFTCVTKALRDDVNGQLAAVYKDHRFVVIEAKKDGVASSGNTEYDVTFDYDKYAGFVNAMADSELTNNMEACIKEAAGDEVTFDKTYVDAETLREAMEQVRITMLISNFGHELKALNVSAKNNETANFDAGFTFEHPSVTIAAPTNYRPVNELMDLIVEVVASMSMPEYGEGEGDLYYDDETDDWWLYDEDLNDNELEEV